MRLKWLRDGVDDFDYVELLKLRGEEAWALEVVGSIAPDWVNWTRDIDAVDAARTTLAERLQDLSCRSQRRTDDAGNCWRARP
jgi:hypothetical protein